MRVCVCVVSGGGRGGIPLVPCLVQAVPTREPYKGYGCGIPQGARKAGCPLSDRLIDLGGESGGGADCVRSEGTGCGEWRIS